MHTHSHTNINIFHRPYPTGAFNARFLKKMRESKLENTPLVMILVRGNLIIRRFIVSFTTFVTMVEKWWGQEVGDTWSGGISCSDVHIIPQHIYFFRSLQNKMCSDKSCRVFVLKYELIKSVTASRSVLTFRGIFRIRTWNENSTINTYSRERLRCLPSYGVYLQ